MRQVRSLMLFFQGHPEYEDTTLLKEYRRDVGRFLDGRQPHYPTVPRGYLPSAAVGLLEEFRQRAHAQRAPQLLKEFPFAAVASALGSSVAPGGHSSLSQLARFSRRGEGAQRAGGIIGRAMRPPAGGESPQAALRDRLLGLIERVLEKPGAGTDAAAAVSLVSSASALSRW